jgi:predicted amidophosphoribosyltransferase
LATEDGFRRFEWLCPNCGLELGEWAEQCPECGQNMFEVYSGRFTARRTRWVRAVAVVLLLVMALLLGTAIWQLIRH